MYIIFSKHVKKKKITNTHFDLNIEINLHADENGRI